MIANQDGLTVAKSFINKHQVTDGFFKLLEVGRLDLTVEALILRPKYRELFSDEEIKIVEDRMREFGYIH